jgi:heptosyltransferase-2
MRWRLITAPLENPSRSNRPSMSSHYFALSGNQAKETPQPKLELPRLFLNEMKEKLQLIQNHDKLFILCPGAEYGPAKQWPVEHFGKLAQMLIEQNSKALVLILGSKKESSLADEIVRLSNSNNQVINWCGQTTLDEAMACIAVADKVISNDSGLMHIAAAFRRPQVAIFGSSDPRHTPPLSPEAKVHWLQLKCSPCFKRTCPLGHLKCLVDIQPQDVLNSLNN